jgi:hypothetical protein
MLVAEIAFKDARVCDKIKQLFGILNRPVATPSDFLIAACAAVDATHAGAPVITVFLSPETSTSANTHAKPKPSSRVFETHSDTNTSKQIGHVRFSLHKSTLSFSIISVVHLDQSVAALAPCAKSPFTLTDVACPDKQQQHTVRSLRHHSAVYTPPRTHLRGVFGISLFT